MNQRSDAIVSVRDLSVHFSAAGILQRFFEKEKPVVCAVDGVTFSVGYRRDSVARRRERKRQDNGRKSDSATRAGHVRHHLA